MNMLSFCIHHACNKYNDVWNMDTWTSCHFVSTMHAMTTKASEKWTHEHAVILYLSCMQWTQHHLKCGHMVDGLAVILYLPCVQWTQRHQKHGHRNMLSFCTSQACNKHTVKCKHYSIFDSHNTCYQNFVLNKSTVVPPDERPSKQQNINIL